MNLSCFNTDSLFNATIQLFDQLGIKINSNTTIPLQASKILGEQYKDRTPFINIKETYFSGLVDDNIFQRNLFDNKIEVKDALNTDHSEGFMVFSLLLDEKPNRTEIAEITRAFNQQSKKMPVMLLLKYNNFISLALPERLLYKQQWREGKKIGKTIILRDINTANTHAGHLRILQDLADHDAKNYGELHGVWLKVLDVGILNKDFYKKLVDWYAKCFADIQINLSGAAKILNKDIDNELKPQAVIRVIVRMMFIWFMKEKGLIKETFFKKDFAAQYLKKQNTYYNAVLQNLFFAVLNKKIDERRFRKDNPKNRYDAESNDYGLFDVFRYKGFFKDEKTANEFVNLTKTIPFVNGGLFQCHDYKFAGKDTITNSWNTEKNYIIDGFSDNINDRTKISDDVIFELIQLFNSYVWTIEESTPTEQDIALDPELLGTVFENLIGFYNPETKESARKQTGSFYTPPEIVEYMCRESLKEALKTKFPALRAQIDDLIDKDEDQLNFPDKNNVLAAITNLKILDPACGSGAFPMGMFMLMVRTIEKLQEHKTTYKNKLDIITNCIYGIDIQNIAIEISKLRFFISLLVDCKTPEHIEDFEVLPNLETKFVVANTLIGINLKGGNLFEQELLTKCNELTKIFTPFTQAKTTKEKTNIKNAFEKKKDELVKLLEANNFGGADVDKIRQWNPFNVCYTSPFFDSAIMFGIADGFDIVIGNPPYVNIEKVDKIIKSNISKFRTAFQKYDLYVLFYEKAIDLLKSHGQLSYITSNKFLSQGYGLLLRKEFLKYFIHTIINFNYDVFDTATVRTCIFNLQKTNQVNENIRIIDVQTERDKDKFSRLEYKFINQNIFNETAENNFRINLTNSKIDILNKIKQNTLRIADIFSVNYGLRPSSEKLKLKKEAFIFETNETGKYKKYFEGKDMGKWKIKSYSYIDYQPDVMYNSMFSELFENKKLVGLRTLSDIEKLRFIYDESNFYCNDSVVVLVLWYLFKNVKNQTISRNITKEKIECSKKFDYSFVQGILNSRLIKFYVNELLYDGTHFYPNHIKSLPIKDIPLTQQLPMITLVNYILFLTEKETSPIYDIISNEVISSCFEKVIDACVYELYFEDEIKKTETDVLYLLEKSLKNIETLPINEQIKQLFSELTEYKNEIRNRIILQETRSESVAQIIKSAY